MRIHSSTEKGASLVELLLVTPFLFLFFMGVIEITRYLAINQIASVLSEEAAARAYRQCGDYTHYERDPNTGDLVLENNAPKLDRTRIQIDTDACLGRVADNLIVPANVMLGNAIDSLVLSVYRFAPTTTTQNVTTCNANVDSISTISRQVGTTATPSRFRLDNNNVVYSNAPTTVLTPEIFIRGLLDTQAYNVGSTALVGNAPVSMSRCLGRQKVVISEITYTHDKIGPISGARPGLDGYGVILDLFTPGRTTQFREATIL